jgi:signal peptidase I
VKNLGQLGSMVIAVVLFSICIGLVAIRTLGMGIFVVTGSSMEPVIHKGAIVLIEPVSPTLISRGDIITFEHYGQMTTHRVVAIDASDPANPIFTTKGDANAVADPEPVHFPGQVGIYRASVPLIGYALVYVQAYWRLAVTILAGAAFLVCAAMLVFGKSKTGRARTRRSIRQPATIDPDELWASHIGWLREASPERIAA